MQVKVCPKCKARNRATSAACSNCYASLEGVPVTEEQAPAQPASAAPRPPSPRPARTAAPPTRQAQPPQPAHQVGVPQQTQQMGIPGQTQMGAPMAPPPGMPQQGMPQPGMPPGQMRIPPPQAKSPVGIIAVVVVCVLLAFGGIGYALMKSGILKGQPRPTEDPAKVAIAFLEAKRTEDLEKCKPYLSRNSIDLINNTLSSPQARSAGFTKKDSADWVLFGNSPTAREMAGKEIAATEMKNDKEADESMAIVQVMIGKKEEAPAAPKPLLPPGQEPPPEPESDREVDFGEMLDFGPIEAQFVLVAEDGKWKVDLEETNRRELGLGKKGNPFKLGK